jgi:hypothetical protein
LVGVGTVGEAIARLAARHAWNESMVLADYDTARAEALQAALGDRDRFPVEHIDARNRDAVAALARRHRSDLVMNAVDPQFVMPIFDGALEAGVGYMDMANSLSVPHPTEPHATPGVKLGDEQFARAADWEASGRLAVLGMGMDPGLSDLFARYAKDHLFDEVHEVHVRDGGDLEIPGVQHLDDDRGVPEPAGRVGRGPGRVGHDPAVQRAGGVPLPGGGGTDGVRERRARGGAPRPALDPGGPEGHLQVRPGV